MAELLVSLALSTGGGAGLQRPQLLGVLLGQNPSGTIWKHRGWLCSPYRIAEGHRAGQWDLGHNVRSHKHSTPQTGETTWVCSWGCLQVLWTLPPLGLYAEQASQVHSLSPGDGATCRDGFGRVMTVSSCVSQSKWKPYGDNAIWNINSKFGIKFRTFPSAGWGDPSPVGLNKEWSTAEGMSQWCQGFPVCECPLDLKVCVLASFFCGPLWFRKRSS